MNKKEFDLWIVETDKGVAFADEKRGIKEFWLGGSPSLVFVPVFESKEDARKFQRKVRKSDNVVWTRIIRAKVIQNDKQTC